MNAGPIGALLDLVHILEALDVRYAIGGSIASSIHGEPRSSADADVVVELDDTQLNTLLSRLGGRYYVSRDAAAQAVRTASAFNVIHLATMYKLDLFVAGRSALDHNQLARRVRAQIETDPPASVFVTAPEDIVLRKLDWFARGGEVSDRQWRDVLGVLKQNAGRLDLRYMRALAEESGLRSFLARALAEAEQGETPRA